MVGQSKNLALTKKGPGCVWNERFQQEMYKGFTKSLVYEREMGVVLGWVGWVGESGCEQVLELLLWHCCSFVDVQK